jgi:hypothetical protein
MATKTKTNVSMGGFTIPEWTMIRPDFKPAIIKGVKRDYERLFWEAEFYIHYEIADKVMAREFVKYAAKHFDKKGAALLRKLPDWQFGNVGKWTYIANKGGVLDEARVKVVEAKYHELLIKAQTASDVEEVELEQIRERPKAPVISIQQRMKEQVSDMLGEWEHFLDLMLDGQITVDKFDPYNKMLGHEVEIKAAHAKIIRDQYASNHDEAREVAAWKDPDIQEAYAHLDTPRKRKAFLEFFEKIATACDTIINTSKATRKTRVKKAPSKEKLVAKIKYKESDSNTGLASMNPLGILESSMLWVFNTRNRKLGVYVADEQTGPLSVKGTAIVGYDPVKSVQKTVRKPEELLKGANKLARTKMQKMYSEIRATETQLNGRLNEHTILIRTF